MIQRLMISSCRSIIGTYRRAVPNLLRVIKAGFPVHCAYILHKRSFYDSAIRSEKINPENGCGVIVNVPTFQIKKRSSKRKTVIHDKIVKPNVSLLYGKLEYCLVQASIREKWENMCERNFFIRSGL